jgi:hypothetical protein
MEFYKHFENGTEITLTIKSSNLECPKLITIPMWGNEFFIVNGKYFDTLTLEPNTEFLTPV